MKSLLLILFLASAVMAQSNRLGISTDYDKFTDTSTVRNTQSIMPARPGFVLFEVVATLFRKRGYSFVLLAVGFLFFGFLFAVCGVWLLCVSVVRLDERRRGGFVRLLLAVACIGLGCTFYWFGFVFW